MSNVTQVRGQPLVALLAVLGGWIGGRAVAWEPPALIVGAVASEAVHAPASASRGGFVFDAVVGPQSLPGSGEAEPQAAFFSARATPWYREVETVAGAIVRLPRPAATTALPFWNPADDAWGPSARGFAPSSASMYRVFPFAGGTSDAGFPVPSRLPSLSALAAQPVPPATVGPSMKPSGAARVEGAPPKRWSGDSWVLMRRDGGAALASGGLPATYGASQAGTVLRYRLATRNDRHPTAYLRVISSLGQLREASAALGLSARPLPKVPIVAALEARVTDQAGSRRVQPAAMAVTELAPFELALDLRGEAYAQAGYVGGEFATPFADGQIRVDRPLLGYGALDARIGAGVWGGAQKGAGRLDFGPTAAISMPLGKRVFGRMALDWRFRVLGNAEPQSGPAVTLSAGF